MKVYVVTVVDYGDSVDGKARTLGVYADRQKAENCLRVDMDAYKGYFKERLDLSERDWAVWLDDHHGCEWNLEEVEFFDKQKGDKDASEKN